MQRLLGIGVALLCRVLFCLALLCFALLCFALLRLSLICFATPLLLPFFAFALILLCFTLFFFVFALHCFSMHWCFLCIVFRLSCRYNFHSIFTLLETNHHSILFTARKSVLISKSRYSRCHFKVHSKQVIVLFYHLLFKLPHLCCARIIWVS